LNQLNAALGGADAPPWDGIRCWTRASTPMFVSPYQDQVCGSEVGLMGSNGMIPSRRWIPSLSLRCVQDDIRLAEHELSTLRLSIEAGIHVTIIARV